MPSNEAREMGCVETVNVEGANQIRLVGECDIASATTLYAHLFALLESGRTRIVFDLEQATFLDSSILRIFLTAHRHVHAIGGEVVLLCRPGFVERLLNLLEIDRLVQVCTPEEWRRQLAIVN